MTLRIDAERRWLAAALAVACFHSALVLRLAFRFPDLVQDDARQHVFWMARFVDPILFRGDLIADYFQAVAPAGFESLYWFFAKCGVEPLVFAKLLPVGIALLSAWLAFRVFLAILPSPRGAFFASVLLSQLLWLTDDVVSATPRAFSYPLFLAFCLALLKRRLLLCLAALALQGLIYPQAAIFSAALLALRLVDFTQGWPRLSRERADYIFCFAGLLTTAAVLGIFANSVSAYGPVIGRSAAQSMPEFLAGGRSEFFASGIGFWLTGARSGFFPKHIPAAHLLLALAAPLLAFRRKDPALRDAIVLAQMLIVALMLWSAAHLFLFHLHLPARYSHWVIRILIAIFAAFTLESAARHLPQRYFNGLMAIGIAGVMALPFLGHKFPNARYSAARPAPLYAFLRTLPKDALIATLSRHGDNIPALAQRRVFLSAEHAIPYHRGYYAEIRARGKELLRAQYTSDAGVLGAFIKNNQVDFLLLETDCFEPDYPGDLRSFRDMVPTQEIADRLAHNEIPALQRLLPRASVWQGGGVIVLDAQRLLAALEGANAP